MLVSMTFICFFIRNKMSVAFFKVSTVFINNGSMERLSVQQVVDCSDNMGCYGGSLSKTLRYVKDKGLMRHDEYPYKAKLSLCDYNGLGELVKVSSWTRLPTSEETLAQAVVNIGPIPVAINASPFTFQLYHKGVYDDPNCPSDKVNHAMLLIGYTKDSWILKNWWSEHWGDQGYIYLKRGKNRCGIANYAAFVKIKSLKTES